MDVAVALARRLGKMPSITPHLNGGSDRDKVEWEYSRAEAFLDVIGRVVDPRRFAGKDVLDCGCGWGGKTVRMAEMLGVHSISGFDLPGVYRPEASASFAAEKGVSCCAFSCGVAEEMAFADGSFDIVVMEDVLEHVRDPEAVLAECCRVLRPAGVVIAKFPSIKMGWAHHLDRAISAPWLHYLLPLRTWAAGLNDCIARGALGPTIEPFSRVVATKYHPAVTSDLNGLDLRGFEHAVAKSGLRTASLELVSFHAKQPPGARTLSGRVYDVMFSIPALREILAESILFVGAKPACDRLA